MVTAANLKMAVNPMDPSILTEIVERKGSLSLRSNHMHYSKGTLFSNWHHDREAEPKDYDIAGKPTEWNLLKATYNRIGNVTDGSLCNTSTKDALNESQELKDDFQTKTVHKTLISQSTFHHATTDRDTGHPQKGYGSLLPRHKDDPGIRHLKTTHGVDFQYPFDWTPKEEEEHKDNIPETKYRRGRSEFSDTADHRRPGCNTWQDYPGSEKNYTQHS